MPDTTVRGCLRDASARLSHLPTPGLDARVLLLHVTGKTLEEVIAEPDAKLTPTEYDNYTSLLARRAAHEPVSQIIGAKEFRGLSFRVTADVLTPRPDSETLIDHALELCSMPPGQVLDLGTGSGCLLAAALSEWPHARGWGVDISPAALEVARENLSRLGLSARASLLHHDFSSAPPVTDIDLILANPPYIPTGEQSDLPPDVRDHEPAEALFAGMDGLDAYRSIACWLPQMMGEGAVAIFEVGAGQAPAVSDIMQEAFLAAGHELSVSVRSDLAGINRSVAAQRVGKR